MRNLLIPIVAFLCLATSPLYETNGSELPPDPPSASSCSDSVYNVEFISDFGQTMNKKCRHELTKIKGIPNFLSKRSRSDKQQFKIDYDTTCQVGIERFSGCDANPDSKTCGDGTAPYLLVVRFSGGPNDGNVLKSNLVCPEDKVDLPKNIVKEIVITPEKFRKYPIQASEVRSDPQKFSLRNGNTHFWAESESQTFHDEVDNEAVAIRAIPIAWIWNYGDGSIRKLSEPGVPRPEHTLHDLTPTSHIYKDTGTFRVTLTTIYRGEFKVGNGKWQDVNGQASVPSEPSVMDVWRTKKELIATD